MFKLKIKIKKIDVNFDKLIKEINYILKKRKLRKHLMIRIDKWIDKLVDEKEANNLQWKRNRNKHARLLLQMILNHNIEEPFTKMPGDGPIQYL